MTSLKYINELINQLKTYNKLLKKEIYDKEELEKRIEKLESEITNINKIAGNLYRNNNHNKTIEYIFKLNKNYILEKEEANFKIQTILGNKTYKLKSIDYLIAEIDPLDNFNLLKKDLSKYGTIIIPKIYSINQNDYNNINSKKTVNNKRETNNNNNNNNNDLWNLLAIQTREAQEITRGNNVNVGVIDTGIDYEHKELINNLDKNNLGYNFIDDSYDPYDDNNHGTHVSGTIAGNNVGIATESRLYALKVLNQDGFGTEANVLKAIDWAIDNKLSLVNMSLGSKYYSYAEEEICKAAYEAGTLIIAAAGNDGDNSYNYPASLPYVISVAAIDKDLEQAYFSNTNDMVDISGPGVNVKSSIPGNRYDYYDGTSMATPHITGSLAILKSYDNSLLPNQLEEIMKTSSMVIGDGDSEKYGSGLVQIMNMINQLK